MFGIDDAIGAGGSIISGLLTLRGQDMQAASQRNALQAAMMNYYLQQQAADRQYQLATASQTDARGNKTLYSPQYGWQTFLSPQSQQLVGQTDKLAAEAGTRELTSGRDERSMALNRRLGEGAAAEPLLAAIRYGYGAPTREGTVGAQNIADVTRAGEAADQAKSGYATAALRTGSGASNLEPTFASIDKGTATGIRGALAGNRANASPIYNAILSDFQKSKLDPYNMLASRASNISNMPFQPEGVSGDLSAAAQNRAGMAAAYGTRGYGNVNTATSPLMAAMLNQRQPSYDMFAAGLTEQLQNLFKRKDNGGIGGRWPGVPGADYGGSGAVF